MSTLNKAQLKAEQARHLCDVIMVDVYAGTTGRPDDPIFDRIISLGELLGSILKDTENLLEELEAEGLKG